MRLGHVLYFDIPYFGGTTWLRRYFRSKDKGVLDEAFGTKGEIVRELRVDAAFGRRIQAIPWL
jgi:hypothetical protein